jgi:hypothetical protein
MRDSYPVNITIEIDRPLLRKYLQWRWGRAVVIVVAGFVGFLGFLGSVDYIRDHARSQAGAFLDIVEVLAISLTLSLVASAVIHFGFVRRRWRVTSTACTCRWKGRFCASASTGCS